MAKKETVPAGDKLASLVAVKIAAGLSQADALEVAERQIKHDEAIAAQAAAKSSPAAE
jgi:hypothetical protein